MPRPTSKPQLLAEMAKEHEALQTLLTKLSVEAMDEDGVVGEWAVKDVLAHLTEWEQMCLGWYRQGLKGERPAMPAEGFNWRQIPQLNQHIFEKHHQQSVKEILDQFRASYAEMLETVQNLSPEALFTPKQYAWTNDNAMATYFISATSSHYHWARNEIRKGLKERKMV